MSALNDEDRENLGAFLDGELDEETARALEGKLNIDPEARKEFDAIKNVHGLLDYLPLRQPSADFTHRTLEKLSLGQVASGTDSALSSWRRRATWSRLAWCAAVVMALGVGFASQRMLAKTTAEEEISDETLVRYMRIVEDWRTFDQIDNLEFLRALDHSDLFGSGLKS